MNKHPILTSLAKGAAIAFGYFGVKYLVTYIHDRVNDPNREPIIKINIQTRRKDEYSNPEK